MSSEVVVAESALFGAALLDTHVLSPRTPLPLSSAVVPALPTWQVGNRGCAGALQAGTGAQVAWSLVAVTLAA